MAGHYIGSYLDRSNGSLSFGISAGSSQTWGDVSGLSVAVSSSSGNLDNYDPDSSKFNSGVTFGATGAVTGNNAVILPASSPDKPSS